MKNLFIFFLLISINCFSQKGKPIQIDSVLLDGNSLFQYRAGVKEFRGSVIIPPSSGGYWNYDPVWETLYSIGAKDSSNESGRWNFVALPLAGRNLTNQSAYNIYIGKGAGQFSKASKNAIGLGWEALKNNMFGSDVVAISEDAMYSNVNGFASNAIGRGALFSHTKSKHNNAFGYNAMQSMTEGEENVSVGSYAMAFQLRGYGNVAIGTYAMENNDHYNYPTTVIRNSVGIGYMAGFNSYGSNCINIGAKTETGLADNKINIGNTIYGDINSGLVSVKSLSIDGREMWADDNYIYVKTSAGTKKVALQDLSTTTATRVPTSFKVYDRDGRLLFVQPVYKN